MKALVIVEHNNKSIKTSTYSTITAQTSQICDAVDALIIGKQFEEAVNEIKKADILKKIYTIDKNGLDNPIAENFSTHILEFLNQNDGYTHILTPSSTFGKNLSPKIATKLDVDKFLT